MAFINLSWFSYVLSGTLALVMSWALTGCRFGNNVVKTEVERCLAGNPDHPLNGCYQTQINSVTTCSLAASEKCESISASQYASVVPSVITRVMTDPVQIYHDSSSNTDHLMPNPISETNGKLDHLPISFDSTGLIQTSSNLGDPYTPWHDPACLVYTTFTQDGQIQQGTPAKVNGATTSGRLSLDMAVITSYGTGCGPTLADMRSCYDDVNQCLASTPEGNQQNQDAIRDMFELYIQTGAMTVNDIPTLQALAWQVSYR